MANLLIFSALSSIISCPTRTRTLNVGTKNRCVTNYTMGQFRVQIYCNLLISQTFFYFFKTGVTFKIYLILNQRLHRFIA